MNMTLHEAIEQVLQIKGKPMSTSEIAENINKKQLYVRNDNAPIQATQIAARIGNYPNLFIRENGKVYLIKKDPATLLFQNVRNNLVHNFDKNLLIHNLLPLDILQKGINEILEIDDDIHLLKEPIQKYGLDKPPKSEDLESIFKLCHWFLLQETNLGRNSFGILTEEFINLLAGLDWFKEKNNTIITNTTSIDYFLFKIIKENKNAMFKIEDNSNPSFITQQKKAFNQYLIELYHNYFKNQNDSKYKNLRTEIIIPPLGFRNAVSETVEFSEILNEIGTREKKLDKAILLVAIGTLTSSRKSHIEARKSIIQSNFLDTIVELPSGVIEKTAVKMALLLFDFKRAPKDKLYFLNTSTLPLSELINVADTINDKKIIEDNSVEVKIEDIETTDYSLLPARYISKEIIFKKEEGYELYTLGQILTDKKTGTNLNSKKSNFYSGGEYKLLRNSDLIKNSIYFTPSKDAIGIDEDLIIIEKLNLVKGGLGISAINQNIKANALPDDEKFVIGNYLHWLKPDYNIVSSEYLAKELLKPYVLKQLDYFTSGSSHVPLIRLNDLLKVKVQIPSIEIQKELLLQELKNKDINQTKSDAISDRELDFIKTLKHSLKQPTAGLGNDFASLKHFLNTKIHSQQTLAIEETIVPIFEDDSPETIERYTLASTLARMERSLTDIDYILEKAITLIAIANLNKKEVELKSLLTIIKAEYPTINLIIKSNKTTLLADESQLKIALHNLIDNAIKHGFKVVNLKPTIWLEVQKKGEDYIELSVRNNGKPLPPEFTIEDFLAKGKSSKADVGSGFGGYLIGQILKNHKGKIELNNNVGNEILPHNVEFIISLPR